MSVGYAWVQWSRHKRVYDATMAGAALAYVAGFVAVSKVMWRGERAISDEIVVLHHGQVVERGSPQVLLREPAHPYTRALLAAVPRERPQARQPTR